MPFIHLTIAVNDFPVSVNSSLIAWIVQTPKICEIHFATDAYIQVKETKSQILAMIPLYVPLPPVQEL